jgi:hypothetical protein
VLAPNVEILRTACLQQAGKRRSPQDEIGTFFRIGTKSNFGEVGFSQVDLFKTNEVALWDLPNLGLTSEFGLNEVVGH